jgi:hypothetical protein
MYVIGGHSKDRTIRELIEIVISDLQDINNSDNKESDIINNLDDCYERLELVIDLIRKGEKHV